MTIAARLRNQWLVNSPAKSPHDVVSRFLCVQAQDYLGALWAIGLRIPGCTEADVERALAERIIIRTYPLRGTLHFIPAEDVRWVLDLLASETLRRAGPRLEKESGLTPAVLRKGRAVVREALQGGQQLTRKELYALLPISDDGRLHLVFRLSLEGLICFGPRQGKQQTFVLLDEWLPKRDAVAHDAAELARRYFVAHAPATAADFAWWSGLSPAIARKLTPQIEDEDDEPAEGVHLLPPFDEYTVAYKDRSALVEPRFAKRINTGYGMLQAVVVVNGLVTGSWKRELDRDRVYVTATMLRPLKRNEKRELEAACDHYRAFLGAREMSLTLR